MRLYVHLENNRALFHGQEQKMEVTERAKAGTKLVEWFEAYKKNEGVIHLQNVDFPHNSTKNINTKV